MDGTRVLRLLLIVPLLAAGLALGGARGVSAATLCGDNPVVPGGYEVISGTVKDSVVVPDGTLCALDHAVVRGGVTIGADAILVATNSEIRGSVSGTNIRALGLSGGVVRGSVAATGPGSGSTTGLSGVEVRGNVTLTGFVQGVDLRDSTVRGGVTLNDNGFVNVDGNVIGGDIACAGNAAVANEGAPNTIGGARLGDCAVL